MCEQVYKIVIKIILIERNLNDVILSSIRFYVGLKKIRSKSITHPARNLQMLLLIRRILRIIVIKIVLTELYLNGVILSLNEFYIQTYSSFGKRDKYSDTQSDKPYPPQNKCQKDPL